MLFIGGGGTDLLSYRYGVRAVASERFQVPEYDAPIERVSRGSCAEGVRLRRLRVHAARPRARALWFDLDVGVRDDLHVLRFHAKEQTEGRTFRWTQATSYVSVTVIADERAR